MSEEIDAKDRSRLNLQDFVRRLAHGLNSEFCDSTHHSPEMVIHKAEELVQEVNHLRTKCTSIETHLTTVEVESKNCRDTLERVNNDRDQLQRQITSQSLEIDRLRQVNIDKLIIYLIDKLKKNWILIYFSLGQRVHGDAVSHSRARNKRTPG